MPTIYQLPRSDDNHIARDLPAPTGSRQRLGLPSGRILSDKRRNDDLEPSIRVGREMLRVEREEGRYLRPQSTGRDHGVVGPTSTQPVAGRPAEKITIGLRVEREDSTRPDEVRVEERERIGG